MFGLLLLIPSVWGFGNLCKEGIQLRGSLGLGDAAPAPNTKVAFFGDQGVGANPTEVLQMIKHWGAEFAVHVGDFDYIDSPTTFMNLVDTNLGPTFPYFVAIGNHDVARWTSGNTSNPSYLDLLNKHYSDSGIAAFCTGELGVNQACNYKGFLFVLSGVGTRGTGHAAFINQTFSSTPAVWKFSAWHKNQHLYQTGDKTDETGYEVYDMTRQHGGMVITGHEHSYSRTKNMLNFATQTIADNHTDLTIKPGQTWAVVTGLGGVGIRAWKNGLQNNPWWQSCASSDNGVSYGALLCTFNIDGRVDKAHCDQVDIKGKIWDSFDIYSENSETVSSVASEPLSPTNFLEFPILSAEDDGSVAIHHHPLHNNNVIRLTFRNIPLDATSMIRAIHLQMYGVSGSHALLHGEKRLGDILIQAESNDTVSQQVSWITGDDEDFEQGEVWVSPNLKDLVLEVMSSGSWQHGRDITFVLTGRGRDVLEMATYGSSPCLAPTLAVQLQ